MAVIRLGKQLGLKRLDFGASDLDLPGLPQFKRKYATEEREIVRYRWQPADHDDTGAQQADKLLNADPTVPDEITKAAGAVMYGLFC